MFAVNSFDLIETATPLSTSTNLLDKDLWKTLYTLLKENGELNLQVTSEHALANGQVEQVTSFMKLNGFANVHIKDQLI